MANKKHNKWRRFMAYLRKYAIAVRNIIIFIAIIAVICWCRSQIHRDANTRAFNEAVAKLTHGPEQYREVVVELEKLEAQLKTQKKDAALLTQVRQQLSQCCAMIAAEPEMKRDEAMMWYHRAWSYDPANDAIPEAMRMHFRNENAAPSEPETVKEEAPKTEVVIEQAEVKAEEVVTVATENAAAVVESAKAEVATAIPETPAAETPAVETPAETPVAPAVPQ